MNRNLLSMTVLPLLICLLVVSTSYILVKGYIARTEADAQHLLTARSERLLDLIDPEETRTDYAAIKLEVDTIMTQFSEKLTQRLQELSRLWMLLSMVGIIGSVYLSFAVGHRLQRGEERIQRVKKEKEEIYQVYQEVISAVTQGTLRLISPEEYRSLCSQEKPMLTVEIIGREDIPRCRDAVDHLFQGLLPNWQNPMRYRILISLSEAVTNVVKHTPGGLLQVFLDADGPRLHIVDRGPGLNLRKLPYMVFLKGFSTSQSFGYGFPIILRYMREVAVCTGDDGTKLVLRPQLDDDTTGQHRVI